ncbi:zinc transporter ZIP11 isoform X3 [Petaurus breviceps papuanus]|uniref:zinc transporter ZIP11 isoform X3 n=1 Tax=Petaurus breviceps papuanus TaxID=3040969 RepID=UPI0036D8146D
MIQGYSPVFQALLGTFFTWGLTAAGAALVFIFTRGQRQILDGSLGFAAGGMAENSQMALMLSFDHKSMKEKVNAEFPLPFHENELSIRIGRTGLHSDKSENGEAYPRKKVAATGMSDDLASSRPPRESRGKQGSDSWRRILLLILAITVHNIPEGLAVGVGFGAIGKTASATFESARNLAVGIGIQNFPEGLAVSLPLRGAGFSTWRAFWFGQLSGMVEPVAGIFGAFSVVLAEPILPYALAFAAGAMVYVVIDDIIPEAQTSGNGKLASWTSILGFVVMMSLDVGLG